MNKLKRLNNKGFTLIELIIAISIFSTIIFIGYRLFDSYNLGVKNQSNTTQIQSAMNNINKYITKDLEKASGISLQCIEPNEGDIFSIENNDATQGESYLQESLNLIKSANKIALTANESKLTYRYTIDTINSSQSPSYTVEMNYNKNNSYIEYSIYRTAQGDPKIEFITDGRIEKEGETFETPFTITKNNPYEVTLSTEESKNKAKTYDFEVASRYIVGNLSEGNIDPETPKPPTPEEIPQPPGFGNEYSSIGFWTADKSKFKPEISSNEKIYKDSLYTWVDDDYKYGSQVDQKEDSFHIKGANPKGNSGKADSYIGYKPEIWRGTVKDGYLKKANSIDKMIMYVSPNTTVKDASIEFQHATLNGIKKLGTTQMLSKINGKYILEGGNNGEWYEIDFTPTSNNKANFEIQGYLSIDKENNDFKLSSGYAVIFCKEVTNNGNIVYEFTKNNGENPGNIKLNTNGRVFIESKEGVTESAGTQYYSEISGTQSVNYNILIKTDQSKVHVQNVNMSDLYNSNIKDIKKVRISIDKGLIVQDLKVFGTSKTINSGSIIEVEMPKKSGQYSIEFKVKFTEIKDNTPTNFKVELLY